MKNVIYWTSTLLVSAFITIIAFIYWGHDSNGTSPIAHYPTYVASLIGMAKVLGVIVLLLPGLPLAKEWAYAGFTFMCVGVIVSVLLLHQGMAVIVPALTQCLLLISYFTRPPTRRLSLGYRFEFY